MTSRRISDFERMEALLAETQRERDEANRRADEADRRTEKAEMRTQKTTFSEYLSVCHDHLNKPMHVETNKNLTTKGSTSSRNKYYPEKLRPWHSFSQLQIKWFETVKDFCQPPGQPNARLFSPIIAVEDNGRNYSQVRLANEMSLRDFVKNTLEVPVTNIINHLCENPQPQDQLQLGQGITFENHDNTLGDAATEVRDRLHIQPPQTPLSRTTRSSSVESRSSSGSDPNQKEKRTLADQYCVFKDLDGKRQLVFVVEYKPPHKLTIGNLRAGFRPMELRPEVIDRITIPTWKEADGEATEEKRVAKEEKLQYNADALVAAVATQTFHYMIQHGLEYSYITTGEAFVFLHIKADDPKTLYYDVAVPTEEPYSDVPEFSLSQTAIGQVLGLCLMAFQSEQRSQEWRKDARKQLSKYRPDWLDILRQIPVSERKMTPKSSAYRGRKGVISSNYDLRSWKGQGNPRKPPDDDQDDNGAPSSPAQTRRSALDKSSKSKSKEKSGGGSGNSKTGGSGATQRQYCTQKCLLGIIQHLAIDKQCPNWSLHPTSRGKHAINQPEFLDLLRTQLARTLDHDCEPLGLQGARGALFKLTLASHGYVFVGKGTVRAFVPDIKHEGHIYQQLEALQGVAVPVCLGNINLKEKYYLDVGVKIRHMLLMAWGGAIAEEDETVKDQPWLKAEMRRTEAQVRAAGIDQMDVRWPNLLWNAEAQRVMLIDFERAERIVGEVEAVAKALRVLSPNKRQKRTKVQKAKDGVNLLEGKAVDRVPVLEEAV